MRSRYLSEGRQAKAVYQVKQSLLLYTCVRDELFYYQVLIEKDWLAFGHPFHLRHAYGMPRGVTSGKEDQRSPIFLQFLDCTWQLVMQLPSYFEFNPRYVHEGWTLSPQAILDPSAG